MSRFKKIIFQSAKMEIFYESKYNYLSNPSKSFRGNFFKHVLIKVILCLKKVKYNITQNGSNLFSKLLFTFIYFEAINLATLQIRIQMIYDRQSTQNKNVIKITYIMEIK